MKRPAGCFPSFLRVLAGAGVVLVALALSSAPCRGAASVCKACVEAGNDTASTPGKTGTSWLFAGTALNPPIAFIGSDHRLRCALPAPPGWQIGIVDFNAMAGGCAMALDSLDQPMISYHDENGMLFWAHRVSDVWVREPIDPSGGVNGATSIARVPGGVGITYTGTATGALKYAELTGTGTWTTEFVTPVGESGSFPSLRADGVARAISYYDPVRGDLHLAMRQTGSGWTSLLIDSAGDVGAYSSLVGSSTASGFGIAYYDLTNRDLKYAHSVAGGWAIETVDGAGVSVGRFCSAVAFAGTPDDLVGIGYYDQTHGDLKYAIKHGPNWTLSVQDTVGDTGGSVSCGMTPVPADTIGITYVDRATGDLYYLWHAGTVAAVPMPGAPGKPLRIEWLRAAAGGSGRVRFTVPAAGSVRVVIYDTAGRVVAVPLSQPLPAGPAEVGWDGRDQKGHAVRAGVVFVRVDTMGGTGAIPAVLLR